MNIKNILVDLGLPSGNLWMKCNLGASCETDYGNYYQWGSLMGYMGERAENHSTWETCPFNNGSEDYDEEYFLKNRSSLVYKNGLLRPDFDIVTQTFGEKYKIPEPKDFQELIDNTTSGFITKDYKGTGIHGRLFTSKINGNSIFIPFSGYVWEGSFSGVGSNCNLWSGGLDSSGPDYACYLYSSSGNTLLGYSDRADGNAIRGIKVKK